MARTAVATNPSQLRRIRKRSFSERFSGREIHRRSRWRRRSGSGPVLEFGAGVQDGVVGQQLDVAGLEVHVEVEPRLGGDGGGTVHPLGVHVGWSSQQSSRPSVAASGHGQTHRRMEITEPSSWRIVASEAGALGTAQGHVGQFLHRVRRGCGS